MSWQSAYWYERIEFLSMLAEQKTTWMCEFMMRWTSYWHDGEHIKKKQIKCCFAEESNILLKNENKFMVWSIW